MENYYLPIAIETMIIRRPGILIYYPQVTKLNNYRVQGHINNIIIQTVYHLFDLINKAGYYKPGETELTGSYEIKNNQRGILSLTLSNFAFMRGMAHPVDNLTAITVDAGTGKVYMLKDLFKEGSDYVETLNRLIQAQIEERNLPVFDSYNGIKENQDYYIADKALVIFFQRYEIGARPLGYPMFPISIYNLQEIIKEDGPLAIMIRD